jgi:hypothetical protein
MNSIEYEKLPKEKLDQLQNPLSKCCDAPPERPLSDGIGICDQCGECQMEDEWYENE